MLWSLGGNVQALHGTRWAAGVRSYDASVIIRPPRTVAEDTL